MSSICKMSIQGIRSFGPEDKDKGVIEFFAPLTLILGPNGTGKTTIIECLKYMTTGEMPPGSKVGGAFIHDPKIAHEREVKAQIRLQFRDMKGEICVAQRSLVATQQAKSITMKTLDGLITRKLKDGTKSSISKRCADLDREIVALLGVSKPVLDNVIFCHQEESNWPLSEGKALKQKFDDIFASTRYVKALESIRNFRKLQGESIKNYQIEIKYLKQNKEKATSIRADLEDRETRYLASRENVEKINEKLQPIQEKLSIIEGRANDIYKLRTNIEKLKSEKSQMEKHAQELSDQIEQEYEGTTDELRQELRQFEGQVQEKEQALEQFTMKQSGLDAKLEKLNNKKSELLLEQGKLEQEAERHTENITKRDSTIRKIAEDIDLTGFSSTVDDSKVEKFFKIMDEKAKERLSQAKEKRSDFEDKESKLQRDIDKERTKKTTLETQQKMKQEQLKKNGMEIRSINQELSRVAASGEKLKDIERDLKRAEMSLDETEKAVDVESLKSEIVQLTKEKSQLDGNLKELDSVMSRMSREASVRSELDLFRKDKTNKEDQVRRLKAKNEDSVCHLLGSFPEEGLSRKLETYINQQAKSVRQSQQKLQTFRSELATLEADNKNCQENLRKKEAELREKEDKIKGICHSQSLEEGIEKIKLDIKEEEDRKGSATGMSYLFKRYQEKLESNDPPCPLCHRPFESQDEVDELRRGLEQKLSMVPQKIEQCSKKLEKFKSQHEKMLLMGPVKNAVMQLEDEIPMLRATSTSISEQIDKLTLDIGEQEDLLESAQMDEATAKSIQPDATMYDAHLRDIRDLNRKISGHSSKLSGGDSDRTMQEVQEEREEIQLKLETINRNLDRKRQKQSEHSEHVQQLKSSVNELRAEKLQIESDLQQRVRLEEQKTQLEDVNATLVTEIEDAKDEMEPLQAKLTELSTEKTRLTNQKEKQWEKDKESYNKVKELKQSVEGVHEEVKRYLREGKDKKLEKSHQDMEKMEVLAQSIMTQKENVVENITSLRKDLDEQKTRQRELGDNLKLRKKKDEITVVTEQVQEAKSKIGDLDIDNLSRERTQLQEKQGNLIKEKHQLEGRKQGLEDEIRKLKRELKDDMFKDAEKQYRDKMIMCRTTELANQDLDKYHRALDRAIMTYHQNKMQDINKIIRELWRNTYKGNDIETIEIRSDQEEKATTTCDKRRSYQYRVVMIKGDAAIDMRGRCSAGQKVLCSLIIRLALAETFCLNCGVLALDEPTTNLDRENIESLAYALVEIIKARSKQANFQLVVITHDEDFVELLGRSDYVEEFFKVRKDQFGCSQLVKARVQDLHSR